MYDMKKFNFKGGRRDESTDGRGNKINVKDNLTNNSFYSFLKGGKTLLYLYEQMISKKYKDKMEKLSVDYLVLQQQTGDSLKLDDYKNGAEKIVGLLTKKNPNLKIYVRINFSTYYF